MVGVLGRKRASGPFPDKNRHVLMFSMGAGNEDHGPALPSNIDDYAAIETATTAAARLGLTYVGHLVYSSDRAGEVALDWNPGYIPRQELIDHVIGDIKTAILAQETYLENKAFMVIVVSGHGGNNFLEEEEHRISQELDVAFHYIRPFPGGSSVRTRKQRKIEVTHADHGEHSVGRYLGLLDSKRLRALNKVAAKDPIRALRSNPAIMGLGFYVLPELGGEKYQDLRSRHPELVRTAKRFVQEDKVIVADAEAGKALMDKNVRDTVARIRKFLRTT
jgi:creatinine amidohydrolase/Fe(II)-dependent formamide hydrolase-like protein